MINYANYDFYKGEYKGSLSVDLFNSLIIKASREIERNVNKKITISSLSAEDKYKVQYVACELVDYYIEQKKQTKSMSIDGVSINYTKSEQQNIKDKKSIFNNLPHELTEYL